jgi:hypothetical protein
MEAADITTIMDNDCQQRMAVGAAMVMVGSESAAKPRTSAYVLKFCCLVGRRDSDQKSNVVV